MDRLFWFVLYRVFFYFFLWNVYARLLGVLFRWNHYSSRNKKAWLPHPTVRRERCNYGKATGECTVGFCLTSIVHHPIGNNEEWYRGKGAESGTLLGVVEISGMPQISPPPPHPSRRRKKNTFRQRSSHVKPIRGLWFFVPGGKGGIKGVEDMVKNPRPPYLYSSFAELVLQRGSKKGDSFVRGVLSMLY